MKSWQNNILLNNLFLAQNNEIKKDLTNKNILMKNSSFDSSFNSVQSINTNLSYLKKEYKNINNHIILAIVRASRSIRVSRDHLRFIRILKILNLICYSKAAAAKQQEELINTGGNAVLANKEISIAQLASLKKFKLIIKLFSKNFTAACIGNKTHSIAIGSSCSKAGLETSNLNYSNSNLSKAGQYLKILNSNLLLRNRKFDLLRSNLAVILKKRIKTFSEIFSAAAILQQHTYTENNYKNLPNKNYIISQYLQNYIQTKLNLNKYKGCCSKAATRVSYNKIIGYKFKNNYNNNFKKNPTCFLGAAANTIYFNGAETYKLLYIFFKSMYCLISKPVFKYTNDKIIIQLFYYLNIPRKKIYRLFSIFYINSIKKKWSTSLVCSANNKKNKDSSNLVTSCSAAKIRFLSNKIYIRLRVRKAISRLKNKINLNLLFKLRKLSLNKIFDNKFKLICEILSNSFNRPVELQLTRLHHPYHDSNILVNILALNLKNKRKKASILLQKIFSKNPVKDLNDPNLISANSIPAFLSGLNIKISGRLMGESIIPRRTTKIFGKGASATGKVNYLDAARITHKNRKGAYTIKITSGQNFF